MLWAFGNYSRFVRPGAVRYAMSIPTAEEDPYGVLASAYRNADGTWVCVAINYSTKEQPFTLTLSDSQKLLWIPYRTSDTEGETLKPLAPTDGHTTLAPRSITTFVTHK